MAKKFDDEGVVPEVDPAQAKLIEARRILAEDCAQMMAFVDEWPQSPSIVSHVDCAGLRKLRDLLNGW
jgi:hypothetical protein